MPEEFFFHVYASSLSCEYREEIDDKVLCHYYAMLPEDAPLCELETCPRGVRK